jgi:hypothetical protein
MVGAIVATPIGAIASCTPRTDYDPHRTDHDLDRTDRGPDRTNHDPDRTDPS